jgi:hypothetical protein
MIQLQISSIKGVELKEPTTIYGWCSYHNMDETTVQVNVAWNWTKEEAKLSKGQKHDTLLVEEVKIIMNSGSIKDPEGRSLSANQFLIPVSLIKGNGFEACKKSIEEEVQKVIEEVQGKTVKKLKK